MRVSNQKERGVSGSRRLSRRRFISAVASTAASSCLPLSAFAQNTSIRESRESASPPPVMVVNSGYCLMIDSVRGSILKLQSTFGVDRDLLIRDHIRLPLFMAEFRNEHGEFKLVSSADAKAITVHKQSGESETTINIEFKQIGELPLDGVVTIRCPDNETLTYWSLELQNGTHSWIGHVRFPVIEVPFDDPTQGDRS